MKFSRNIELKKFLKNPSIKFIGSGSQGNCFHNIKTGDVYKIFHQFFDDDCDYDLKVKYDKDQLLQFKSVINDTYIWQDDTIEVAGEVVGVISKYVKGKNLYTINPLNINLDEIAKSIKPVYRDTEIISNSGIHSYDVTYNTMYGEDGFKIIDTEEYFKKDTDNKTLISINKDNFNISLMQFLIDSYLEDFINDYKILKEMYLAKGVNVEEFILLLQKLLSEVEGYKVVELKDAPKCLNKRRVGSGQYLRRIR